MARKKKKGAPRLLWWLLALALAAGAWHFWGPPEAPGTAPAGERPRGQQQEQAGGAKEPQGAPGAAPEAAKGGAALPPPPAGEVKGRLALVIDDFGYAQGPIQAFAALPRPLTFAVLPYRPHSAEALAAARAAGKEALLHLPLQPQQGAAASESVTIGPAMADGDIRAVTERALASLPGVVGVNNHQGSLATADGRVMRQVLGVLRGQGLFFVDSRTSAQSLGRLTARQQGVAAAENDLFLDNVDEVEAVKEKVRTAGHLALRHGSAVAIGHARPHTAAAIRELIPELERKGIRLVFVSQLVD